ncbi:hypothetical protein EC973_001032 [Apophysomyces ossiformis]|uniref:C2H2-type domain-containing protein n=1 Tax=Apophysomyces ossiformis TaxID=679940 RepID=A0A8H7ESB6_9FUNG|nr:hypothetical protein EC973_001032 [Apophysomyces ossiformis]
MSRHDVFVDVSRPTSEQPMDYQEKLADLGLPEGSSFSDDVGYPANFYEIMPNTLPATSVWYGLAMVSPPQLGLSTPSSLTDITDNESGCLTPETPCIIPNALAGQTSTDVAHPTPTEAARSPSNKYHCHGCQEDFINRHVFNRHQTSDKHLKSTGQVLGSNRIYRCEFCEYQANRVDALNRHRKQVHLKQ